MYLEYLKEPLDQNIRSVQLPQPLPNLPKFKGEGDPNWHIKSYTTTIRELLPWNGVVEKIVPKTLEVITLDWYYHLPEASIHSFRQLIREFVMDFDMNKLIKTGIREFLTMKQEPNESVAHFVTRWRQVFYSSTSAPNMDHRELCDLFLHALNKDMREDVQKLTYKSYEEALESVSRIFHHSHSHFYYNSIFDSCLHGSTRCF